MMSIFRTVSGRSRWLPGCLLALLAAGMSPGEEAAARSSINPARDLPAPEARGGRYPVPLPNYFQKPAPTVTCWDWTCELADGTGLAFGGIHQQADDGNPHTSIKDGEKWKPIADDLRKANPLQPFQARVWGVRTACKDTLAKARYLFFEGKSAEEEAKLLKAGVDPAIDAMIGSLAAVKSELKARAAADAYENGQVAFAVQHLDAASARIQPFGGRTTPEKLADLRQAQIQLELAAEALDAEPPPRALSKIVYDPATRLFVLFGGEHFDYVTNDLWVFDPAKRRWFQRHPASAPEPRADHHLDASGNGTIAMCGGFTHSARPTYIHVGPARWIYDLARDVWSADGHQEKAVAADARTYTTAPEAFMQGPRPDAAAQEAKLKALPVNTWVPMKPAIIPEGRCWGTSPLDAERDMIYLFAGGHGSHGGSDVARYHLATDRWEITDPYELPLGGVASNENYPSGVTFNRRPWVRKHVWNSQSYDAKVRKMVNAGVAGGIPDRHFYLYDPDTADWVSRLPVPEGYDNGAGSNQLRDTPHGMFSWGRGRNDPGLWLLNAQSLAWERVVFQGTLPNPEYDCSGMAYDPKRDRMLFVKPGFGKPNDGQIYALDFATKKVVPLNPEGMDSTKTWWFDPREVAYHPGADLFVWNVFYQKGASCYALPVLDRVPAYDPAKNRWVLAKVSAAPGPNWKGVPMIAGVSSLMVFDAKRGLFWAGNMDTLGGMWAMRFDAATADIVPKNDFVVPAADAKK
jgi:hypothetical protein